MFVDILLLDMVLLLGTAVLIAYVGLTSYFAMRRNDAEGVKSALKGAAVPLGGLGFVATTLSLWGQFAWPLPGSYNILFTDVTLLFGVTVLAVAISMALSLKLQYAGVLALVAGGSAIAYGYDGWKLGMTKEPFEMFLLYGAFGLAGILSVPATLVVDHFLGHPNGTAFARPASLANARRRPSIQIATRAAQPITPTGSDSSVDTVVAPVFRIPVYISVTVLAFVAVMALAAIAALFFMDSTMPAHLAKAP